MAIELLVRKAGDDTEESRSVPVATASHFDRYWAPTASDLGLQWVPHFKTGFPVTADDVPFVLGELERLRERLSSSGGEAAQAVLPRLDMLVAELKSAAQNSGVELYIG